MGLQSLGLVKSYGGVQALKKGSLQIEPGEIVALLGENGAGKSTLIRCLAGLQQPDSGKIMLDGQDIVLSSPAVAQKNGVVLVPQEMDLAPTMSVLDNIFLGVEPLSGGRLLTIQEERRELEAFSAAYDFPIPSPGIVAGTLSLADQQITALVRAFIRKPRIILLDEPTSALEPSMVDRLFNLVRRLATDGVGFVFVSHRMEEIRSLASRIVVMRDGTVISEYPVDTPESELFTAMAGHQVDKTALRTNRGAPNGPAMLSVTDIHLTPGSPAINFTLKEGEIVGVSGLQGQGQAEFLSVLAGALRVPGTIEVENTVVTRPSVKRMIRSGVVLVPEDRRTQGLMLMRSIKENLSLPGLSRLSRLSWMSVGRERDVYSKMVDRLAVKTSGAQQAVGDLSGGTQQKVVFGKYLWMQPKVWLLSDPTRGIDVTTKNELYELITEMASDGTAFLLWSTDIDELLAICDRVIVMYEFGIIREFKGAEMNKTNLLQSAFGRGGIDDEDASR